MSEFPHVPQQISDTISENLAKLAELFPAAVKDGALDIEALRAELGEFEEIKPGDETYELNWVGKRAAKKEAFKPLLGKTLALKDDGKNSDTTQNLYIEGDNLEALKLLRQNYYGEVKMIYIDPPYNTGKDFIYTDKFATGSEESELEEGSRSLEGKRLIKNEKSSNRFHARWLDMIYPLLRLSKELLAENGVIFVSIDDSETSNLKCLLDEVFGQENFIDTIAVEMSTTSGPKTVNAQQGTIVKNVEFVHVYRRSGQFDKTPHTPLLDGIESYDTHYSIWMHEDGTLGSLSEQLLQNTQVAHDIKTYNLIDRGKFSINNMDKLLPLSEAANEFVRRNLTKIARVDRPPVSAAEQSTPVGKWKSFEVEHRTYYLTTLANGALQALMPLSLNYRMSDDYKPKFGRTVIRGDLWKGFHQDMGNVAKEGDIAFANGKKPVRLIKQLLKWSSNSRDETIVDFFSGSATTAHAVMQINAEDGGKRKFIMVQLPEQCAADSDAAKLGFATIPEVGRERIRRAGEKIKEDLQTKHAEWRKRQALESKKGSKLNFEDDAKEETNPYVIDPNSLDIGFKSFRIEDTKINWLKKDLRGEQLEFSDTTTQDALDFVPGYTDGDVVYELMLRQSNIPLTGAITKPIAVAKRTYLYADAYLVCLEEKITQKLVEALSAIEPTPNKYFFRDSAFGTDIALKDETFRRLKAEIHKHHGDLGSAYTVEFI
jgi:adenine-specific DNA-methyltransferase